jgi:hypothetical protein
MRGPLSEEALAALRMHPPLPNAVCAAAGPVVAIARNPPVIVNDLGRLIIGNLALYLHYSRDPADPGSGLSAIRMTTLCVEQKACSKGRALAAMALVRNAGDLVPAACQVDQRQRLLVSTGKLIGTCKQYWEAIFRGIAVVIPELSDAIAALYCEPAWAAFLRVFGSYFRAGIGMFKPGEGLTPFAQRCRVCHPSQLLVASDMSKTVQRVHRLLRGYRYGSHEALWRLSPASRAGIGHGGRGVPCRALRSGQSANCSSAASTECYPRLLCLRVPALGLLHADSSGSSGSRRRTVKTDRFPNDISRSVTRL